MMKSMRLGDRSLRGLRDLPKIFSTDIGCFGNGLSVGSRRGKPSGCQSLQSASEATTSRLEKLSPTRTATAECGFKLGNFKVVQARSWSCRVAPTGFSVRCRFLRKLTKSFILRSPP